MPLLTLFGHAVTSSTWTHTPTVSCVATVSSAHSKTKHHVATVSCVATVSSVHAFVPGAVFPSATATVARRTVSAPPTPSVRRVGKARFVELFRRFGQAELGGQLDDFLNRLSAVTRGYPTPHVATHLPQSGSDPIPTDVPGATGKVAAEGVADTLLRSDATIEQGIVTAKGDLLTHDANTAERLPVGATEGYVLAVQAAQTTGLAWVRPMEFPIRTVINVSYDQVAEADGMILVDANQGEIEIRLPFPPEA